MIIKKTILIECYCEECGKGMLQELLKVGYVFNKPVFGNKIRCSKCNHENMIEDMILLIPDQFGLKRINTEH